MQQSQSLLNGHIMNLREKGGGGGELNQQVALRKPMIQPEIQIPFTKHPLNMRIR